MPFNILLESTPGLQVNSLEAFTNQYSGGLQNILPSQSKQQAFSQRRKQFKKKKNKHGLKPLKLLQLKTLERSTGKKNKKIQRCNRLNGLNYKHAMVRDREGETQW